MWCSCYSYTGNEYIQSTTENWIKKERKEKRQSIFKEFIAFINKGNAIALAIGVILGGAFNAIVTAINKNIISPIIALCLGDTDLTNSLQTVLKYRTADATDVANGLATTVGEQIPGIVFHGVHSFNQ